MSRLLVVVACAALCSGCMVVGLERNATRRFEDPPLTVERAKLNCDELEKSAAPATPLRGVTERQLTAAWGAPDDVEIIDGIKRWTYKTDWRWNGVWGIFVVIPVPLVIPAGHEKIVVEFADGRVRSAEVHYQVGHELGCGLVLIHGGGWNCSSGEANHYYGLHSAFCGYEKIFDRAGK